MENIQLAVDVVSVTADTFQTQRPIADQIEDESLILIELKFRLPLLDNERIEYSYNSNDESTAALFKKKEKFMTEILAHN